MSRYLDREMADGRRIAVRPELGPWFEHYRMTPELLATLRSRAWPEHAPRFTLLVRPNDNPPEWLEQTLQGITAQTYPHWEAFVVSDNAAVVTDLAARYGGDGRIRFLAGPPQVALSAARGEYFCVVDHGDGLEPHALHRFADAILIDEADVLYGDAVVTGASLETVRVVRSSGVLLRLLPGPRLLDHPVALRTELLRRRGLVCPGDADPEADRLLRVLELARRVSHIPDILYRRRHTPEPVAADLRLRAEAAPGAIAAGCGRPRHGPRRLLDVRWPSAGGRVAVIIPTRDRVDLLQALAAWRRPSRKVCSMSASSIMSRAPATHAYLGELRRRHQVLAYQGPFNFSLLNNFAAGATQGEALLFLNNDVEVVTPDWLEAMLDFGGATTSAPSARVAVPRPDRAARRHCWTALRRRPRPQARGPSLPTGRRGAGRDMTLLAVRDQSIVTAACLLVRADVFREVRFRPRFRGRLW
jgi:hypothetical protein